MSLPDRLDTVRERRLALQATSTTQSLLEAKGTRIVEGGRLVFGLDAPARAPRESTSVGVWQLQVSCGDRASAGRMR